MDNANLKVIDKVKELLENAERCNLFGYVEIQIFLQNGKSNQTINIDTHKTIKID